VKPTLCPDFSELNRGGGTLPPCIFLLVVWVVVVLLTGGVLLFVILHFRPLTEVEVSDLASKRRQRAISFSYKFERQELVADPLLKKAMPANGGFMRFEYGMQSFPCVAAALLKYKKHEWILVAFEREERIRDVWVNKGPSKSLVHCHLPVPLLLQHAKRLGSTSVLIFHNHPNPDPGTLDCTQASHQDFVSANYYATEFAPHALGLVEFVCERGMHYEYFRYFPDGFRCVSAFEPSIIQANNRSKFGNLQLHVQRLFG
jgi:hypothetical protein